MSHDNSLGQYVFVDEKIPTPKNILLSPKVEGRKLILPIRLEGYSDGYDSMIQDEYEATYDMEMQARWEFVRRIRVFTRPLHIGIDGKQFECKECEDYWKIYPRKKDEIINI